VFVVNCVSFESIISDIGREALIEANARKDAIEHAEVCERCSLRLSNEKLLSANLRALANMDASEAPSRVEANLLNAFRETNVGKNSVPVKAGMIGRYLLIAASVLIIAMVGAALKIILKRDSSEPSIATQQSPNTRRETVTDQKLVQVENKAEDVKDNKTFSSSRVRKNHIARKALSKPYAQMVNTSSLGEKEVATPFFPINPSALQASMESGQLVRVKLPRSTLASFGLPVNMERINEPINADVVLGDDGLVHAIRFVNQIER
jgi:hypothetical protein